MFWDARAKNQTIVDDFLQRQPQRRGTPRDNDIATLKAWRQMVEGRIEAFLGEDPIGALARTPIQYMPDIEGLGPITAQLEAVNEKATSTALLWTMEVKMPFPEDFSEIDEEDMEALFVVEFIKLLFLNAIQDGPALEGKTRVALARTLETTAPNKHFSQVARLFNAATLAVDSAVETEVVDALAQATGAARSDAVEYLMITDINFVLNRLTRIQADATHRLLDAPENLKAPDHHTIASLFAQIDVMARAAALLVKYGPEMETDTDDEGNFVYGNTDFLQYLIRTARSRALTHIDECRRQGIPCPGPIADFQHAEMKRDDANADKLHDVVEHYWRASLGAKALVMAFGSPGVAAIGDTDRAVSASSGGSTPIAAGAIESANLPAN